MAISKPFVSLAEQLAEVEDPTPRDRDPEALDDEHESARDSIDESAASADEGLGREHYQDVGYE